MKTLEQIEKEQLLKFKAQIKRLEESTSRIRVYSALQLDHNALRDELTFAKQIIEAMQISNVRYHIFSPSDIHSDTCSKCGKIESYTGTGHVKK